jgi:hypothetical protein
LNDGHVKKCVRTTVNILTPWLGGCSRYFSFVSTFTELQEVTISLIMSVCICLEQLDSRWMDFHEILYLSIFQKSVAEIQGSLKPVKNSGYFK